MNDSDFDPSTGVRLPTSCDFNEGGQCNFGNQYDRFGDNVSKTCLKINNSPFKKNGRAYYCMPPKFFGKPGNGKGIRIECDPNSGGSIFNYSDLLNPKGIDSATSFEKYEAIVSKRAYLQSNCRFCGTDGNGKATECPNWATAAPPTATDCEVKITNNCTFGGSSGKQNCYDANKSNTYLGRKYFCGGNTSQTGTNQGLTYTCDKSLSTLNSTSQVFDKNTIGGVDYYTLKSSAATLWGCITGTTPIVRRTDCRLVNTSPDCTFGNQITGTTPTNCAEEGTSVIMEQGGKYHYCRPGTNKIVNCDTQLSYSTVFKTESVSSNTKYLPDFKDSSISSKCREGWADIAGSFGSTSRKTTLAADVSPIGLIKTLSNFLFYFAILYFVLLILSNGFAYVRAAEDPGKLKEIKASLFNTIAGFLFVLLSGGLIISLINQIGL